MGRIVKHKHLVVEYLEKVSSEILEAYKKEIKQYSRGRNGIYALYSGKKLYYVGLASSLSGRLNMHLRDRHKGRWDSFSMYLTADTSYLKEIESLILRIADIEGNRVKGKLKGASDLRSEIVRTIKYSQQAELDFLMGRSGSRRGQAIASTKVNQNQTELVRYGLAKTRIRAMYKGKVYKARIDRNGWVIYKGKRFPALSAAGIHILGRTCNGWTFWHAKNRQGKWVKIDTWR